MAGSGITRHLPARQVKRPPREFANRVSPPADGEEVGYAFSNLPYALGFKVDGRLEASIHVHRDGLVAMGDLPRVAGLAQAQRVAEPDIRFRAVGAASCQMDQAVAERDVIADCNVQVSDLIADLASPR